MSVCATCGGKMYPHDFIGMFCPICTYRSIELSFEISAGLTDGIKERNSMHYKNGRPVKLGDQIVYKGWDNNVRAGAVTTANGMAATCNLTIQPALGGNIDCATAGDVYHVEDAFMVIEDQFKPRATPEMPESLPQVVGVSYEPAMGGQSANG